GMVVVPVDPEVHKTQCVEANGRKNLDEPGQVGAVRRVQLEHHDGDENSDHAIAKGFQTGLGNVTVGMKWSVNVGRSRVLKGLVGNRPLLSPPWTDGSPVYGVENRLDALRGHANGRTMHGHEHLAGLHLLL